jgi:hypothetical protein
MSVTLMLDFVDANKNSVQIGSLYNCLHGEGIPRVWKCQNLHMPEHLNLHYETVRLD